MNLIINVAVTNMETSDFENDQPVGKDLHELAEPHYSKRMRCELQNSNNLDTRKYVRNLLIK